jgi:hypothetical protein
MPSVFPGLCGDCAYSRVVDNGRSLFYLCERALSDPRFRKYPALPVLACPGYRRNDPPATPPETGPDDKLTG